jgi:hypothetical protein
LCLEIDDGVFFWVDCLIKFGNGIFLGVGFHLTVALVDVDVNHSGLYELILFLGQFVRELLVLWFIQSDDLLYRGQLLQFHVQVEQLCVVVKLQCLDLLLCVFLLKVPFLQQWLIPFLVELNGGETRLRNLHINSPQFGVIDGESPLEFTLQFDNQSVVTLQFAFECSDGNIVLFEFLAIGCTLLLVGFVLLGGVLTLI